MKKILVFLIFAFGLLIFLWPVLIEGKIYSLGGITKGDLLNFHYPNYKFFHDSLALGRLPLWTNQIGGGFPIMAEGQLGVFYPFNLLFFKFFDVRVAIGLLLFIHLLIASIGMYFLIYKLTRSYFSSIISAFSFSLSGFVVTQLVQVNYLMTFSWFPLVFLVYLKLREKFKLSTLVWLGILMAMQILSGFLAIFYYQTVVIIIFNLLLSWTNWKLQIKLFLITLLSITIAISISAIQLVPTLELFLMSSREGGIPIENQEYFLFPKEGFLSFFGIKTPKDPEWMTDSPQARQAPLLKNPYAYYAYLGILPILALPFGIWLLIKKKKYAFILCLVWVFLMTLGSATPFFKFFYNLIPAMKYFRHSIRFLAFVEFFLVVISAFGIAYLERYVRGKMKPIVLISLLVIVFADLYLHQRNINPVSDPDFWLKPPEIVSHIDHSYRFRVAGYDLSRASLKVFSNNEVQKELLNFLPPNYLSIFNLPSNTIYAALDISKINPFPYKNRLTNELEFTIAVQQQKGDDTNEITFTDDSIKVYQAQAVKYIVFAFPLKNPSLKLLWQKKLIYPSLDEVLVKDVDLNGQVTQITAVPIKINNVYLYELDDALPRVRLVSEAVAQKPDQNSDELFTSDFDIKKKIYVEGITEDRLLGGEGKAEIVSDNGNSLEVATNADKPSWLYVADTYYPGWHVYVDGKETKIYKANYAFRAVKLSQGQHQVIFKYQPMFFKIGMIISLISIVIVIILFRFKHETKTGF